jgi:hypothetical protein
MTDSWHDFLHSVELQDQIRCDHRFYPVTQELDWGPLHKVIPESMCGGWMFMQMYANTGACFYKHSWTRAALIVAQDGRIVEDRRTHLGPCAVCGRLVTEEDVAYEYASDADNLIQHTPCPGAPA